MSLDVLGIGSIRGKSQKENERSFEPSNGTDREGSDEREHWMPSHVATVDPPAQCPHGCQDTSLEVCHFWKNPAELENTTIERLTRF